MSRPCSSTDFLFCSVTSVFTLPDPTQDLALEDLTFYFCCPDSVTDSPLSFPEVLCMTDVTAAISGLEGREGNGCFVFPAGSTQTRHIPEDTPNGFHLQSVSKLLLVISCV